MGELSNLFKGRGVADLKLIRANSDDFDFLKEVHHITLKEHVLKIWGWDQKREQGVEVGRFQGEFTSEKAL